jgi:hypothetical protein
MGQNNFSKMTELSVNVTELSVDSIEFHFSGDYCLFHTLNTTRLDFSEFHWIFLNFLKIDGIDQLWIFASYQLSNTGVKMTIGEVPVKQDRTVYHRSRLNRICLVSVNWAT